MGESKLLVVPLADDLFEFGFDVFFFNSWDANILKHRNCCNPGGMCKTGRWIVETTLSVIFFLSKSLHIFSQSLCDQFYFVNTVTHFIPNVVRNFSKMPPITFNFIYKLAENDDWVHNHVYVCRLRWPKFRSHCGETATGTFFR